MEVGSGPTVMPDCVFDAYVAVPREDQTAEAHAGVEDLVLALLNADAERDGEENAEEEAEEEEEASSISSLSEPSGGDDLGAGAVDPVADSEMAGKPNGPTTNAASSCGQIGVPMTPGLAQLTPELVPVPPPADLSKLSVLNRISCLPESSFHFGMV
jgi:hypothetical protein